MVEKTLEISSNEKLLIAIHYLQFCVHSDKKKMLEELTRDIHQSPNKEKVVSELAQCIASGMLHKGGEMDLVGGAGQYLSGKGHRKRR